MLKMRGDETSLSMKSKINEQNDDESSELKTLLSKLEKELIEVKGEVTSLKKDIKQVKESEAFLHFKKKKKINIIFPINVNTIRKIRYNIFYNSNNRFNGSRIINAFNITFIR